MNNKIREERKSRGLSLKELSDILSIPYSSLSQYERGERQPKNTVWEKLANFFEVSIPYIMGLTESRTDEELEVKKKISEQIKDINSKMSTSENEEIVSIMDNLAETMERISVNLKKSYEKEALTAFEGLNDIGRQELINYSKYLKTKKEYKEPEKLNISIKKAR